MVEATDINAIQRSAKTLRLKQVQNITILRNQMGVTEAVNGYIEQKQLAWYVWPCTKNSTTRLPRQSSE